MVNFCLFLRNSAQNSDNPPMKSWFFTIILFGFAYSFHAQSATGIDANCSQVIEAQQLVTFNSATAIVGTYNERKATYDYLKKNKFPISDYYKLVETAPLTNNYQIDKFNPLLDTERNYNWNKIKANYQNAVNEVNSASRSKTFSDEYYDSYGNFRSVHQCQNETGCLGLRAYCAEEVAHKSVVDKMKLYMRVNENCQKGNKQDEELESFIKKCDEAINNLNFLSNVGKDIKKISDKKNKQAEDFFYNVNKEFSQFKDNWEKLKKESVAKLADYQLLQKEKQWNQQLADEQAKKEKAMKPAMEEMSKCAAFSVDRDKDVQNRNLAQNLCGKKSAQQLPTYNAGELAQLEINMDNVEQKIVDDMAKNISKTAFHESLMSLWAINDPLPQSEKAAKNIACTHAPGLCKIAGFDKVISDAFAKYQAQVAIKPVKKLDVVARYGAFESIMKPAMNRMNELCSTYRSQVSKELIQEKNNRAKPNPLTVADKTYVDPTRVNNQIDQYITNKGAENLMNQLLPLYHGIVNSDLGYLMISDKMKNDIGYFSPQKMSEHCLYGDGKLFNNVTPENLIAADLDFKKMVKDEVKKINDDFTDIDKKQKSQIDHFLELDKEAQDQYIEQILKTNPLTLTKMLQNNPDPRFVHALCKYIMSIEDEDYRKRIGQYVLSGVGSVAGVALMFTGVGSAAGAGLLALSMSATAGEVSLILDDKIEHAQNEKLINQAAATGQYDLDQAINQSMLQKKQSEGAIEDILWVAGPAVVGLGVGKIAQSITKLQRFSTLSKLTNLEKGAVTLSNGVDELKDATKGLSLLEKTLGKEALVQSKVFSQLSKEEALQLGAILNSLDEAGQLKLIAKIKEFKSSAELSSFLKQSHLHIDELIATGKIDQTKITKLADDVKTNPESGIDDLNKQLIKWDQERAAHVTKGDYVEVDGIPRLKGGMHTEESVQELMNVNPLVKEKIFNPETGFVKEEFLIRHPNGVIEVKLPKEAYTSQHWKMVKAVAEKYNRAVYEMIDGTEYVSKTIFPKAWDEAKILQASNELKTKVTPKVNPRDGFAEYDGVVDGVRMRLVTDPEGNIKTVFPVARGN